MAAATTSMLGQMLGSLLNHVAAHPVYKKAVKNANAKGVPPPSPQEFMQQAMGQGRNGPPVLTSAQMQAGPQQPQVP